MTAEEFFGVTDEPKKAPRKSRMRGKKPEALIPVLVTGDLWYNSKHARKGSARHPIRLGNKRRDNSLVM